MPDPFPTFKDTFNSSGADMREALTQPGLDASRLNTLSTNLTSDRTLLTSLVSGDIQPSVKALPTPAQKAAACLAAQGHYAIGVIRDFAGDADTYDQTIKSLNARHGRIVTDRVNAMHHTPEHRRTPVNRADVEASVTAQLDPEFRAAKQRLNAGIDQTATRLEGGIDPATVKSLLLHGLIPLSAANLYPDVTLTPLERSLARLAAGIDVPLPAGTQPAQVLAWWKGLDPSAQKSLIEQIPEFVGNTDGIPAADRDTANRARLPGLIEEAEQYVEDHPDDKGAAEDLAGLRELHRQLYGDDRSTPHPDYQLLLVDNSDHPLKAALSNGSVDEADIVSTFIGGTTSTVKGFSGDMIRLNNQSAEVLHQLRATGDDRTQVGILWLGYDAPDNIVDPGRRDAALAMAKQSWKGFFLPGDQTYLEDAVDILLRDGGDTQDAINTRFAKEGAPALANFAEGIQATNPDARQTGSAHSYGAAVLGGAAQDSDAYSTITVSGGPGMLTEDRDDLHVDDVYVSEAQWRDQDYSDVIGPGGRPNFDEILDLLKDGGDFVPDIGQVDHRFGSDPSDLDGVTLFDNEAATIDDRDLGAAHGHSSYWDRDGHALYNEANAIIGAHDRVSTR